MKIKFNSDDDLPLNKPLKVHDLLLKKVVIFIRKVLKMLQYKNIDVSQGIDINKISASKECMLCNYWYFKDVGFKFESHVCNKCYHVLMTAYKLKNIAILNVKGVDFRCILWGY